MRCIHGKGFLGHLAMAALLAPAGVFGATELVFDGKATPTEVTGKPGTEHTLTLSGPKGVKTISWGESKDRPCFIEIKGRKLSNSALALNATHTECEGGDWGKDILVVGFGSMESATYLTGARVCLNKDGDRVKGLEVRGKALKDDGSVSDLPNEPQEHRPNCADWQKWVNCPAGQIVSGIVAQFEKAKDPKSLSGIRLLCNAVAVEPLAQTPPKWVGEATAVEGISGIKGELIELKPGGATAYGIDTFFWGERRDNPCNVRVEGRDLGNRNARKDIEVDKCDGKTGDKSRLTIKLTDSEGNAFVSGVRVAMNNGRVKAVEVEVKDVPWSYGNPPKKKRAQEKDTNAAYQLNAMITQDWRDWVRCPQGQIAVGLRAHFEREGNNPRSLTGLGLWCRAVE